MRRIEVIGRLLVCVVCLLAACPAFAEHEVRFDDLIVTIPKGWIATVDDTSVTLEPGDLVEKEEGLFVVINLPEIESGSLDNYFGDEWDALADEATVTEKKGPDKVKHANGWEGLEGTAYMTYEKEGKSFVKLTTYKIEHMHLSCVLTADNDSLTKTYQKEIDSIMKSLRWEPKKKPKQ